MAKTLTKLSCMGVLFGSILLSTSVLAESLESVVQHTIRTNPSVLISTNIQDASDQTVKQAKARYYPVLDIYGGIGRERSDNFNTGDKTVTLWRRELGASLRTNIFEGFATVHDVHRTQAKADSNSYGVYASSEDIALAVSEAYLNVLRYEKIVSLARENLTTHQHLFDKVQARGESGIGREADIYQASGRLALAQSNLVAAQNSYLNARTRYYKLTGVNPRNLTMPRKPGDRWMPTSESDAVHKALKYHPKMRLSIIDVDQAIEQHKITQSTAFPVVDFVIEAHNNRDVHGAVGEDNGLLAMVDVRYNLFRGGYDVARQRETAFQAQEAAEIRNRTCREVTENMRLAWNNKYAAEKRLPALQTHRSSSVQAAEAYDDQFKLGKRSLLDLLDSQNERFTAATRAIDGMFDAYIARYQILNAYGSLNKFLSVKLPESADEQFNSYNASANPTVVSRHSDAKPKEKQLFSGLFSKQDHVVVAKSNFENDHLSQVDNQQIAYAVDPTPSPKQALNKLVIEKEADQSSKKFIVENKPNKAIAAVTSPKIKSFTSNSNWSIRVGSYTSEQKVNKIVSSLKDNGLNGFIKEHSLNNKTTYEIYVGPSKSKNEINQLMSRLKKINLNGEIVSTT